MTDFDEADAKCADCSKPYKKHGLDVVLPPVQWERMTKYDRNGAGIILCGLCIARRAQFMGATVVHAVMEFIPASENATLGDEQ